MQVKGTGENYRQSIGSEMKKKVYLAGLEIMNKIYTETYNALAPECVGDG